MKPPSTGPTTGANSAGQVISAVAPSSSDFEALRSTRMRPTGVISALPRPCTTRAATNAVRLCEKPQAIEASVNRAMAARNMLRAPKRSASQPDSGTNTAMVSM